MTLKFVNPQTVAKPAAAYSTLAIVPAGRRLLVLSGQVGNRLDGSFVEGLEAQFEQALANVKAVVASEGGTAADIARVTCFLVEKPMVPACFDHDATGLRADRRPSAACKKQTCRTIRCNSLSLAPGLSCGGVFATAGA